MKKYTLLILIAVIALSSCLSFFLTPDPASDPASDYAAEPWFENDQRNYRITNHSYPIDHVATPSYNRLRVVMGYFYSYMYLDFYEDDLAKYAYVYDKFFEWHGVSVENEIIDNSKLIVEYETSYTSFRREDGKKPIVRSGYWRDSNTDVFREPIDNADFMESVAYKYYKKVQFVFVRDNGESFLEIVLPGKEDDDRVFRIDYPTAEYLKETTNVDGIKKVIIRINQRIETEAKEKAELQRQKEEERGLLN